MECAESALSYLNKRKSRKNELDLKKEKQYII